MRVRTCSLWVCIFVGAARLGLCQDDLAQQLKEALQPVIEHQTGQDRRAFEVAASLVVTIANEDHGAEIAEPLLLDALSRASSREAKSFLCKQLFIVGTEKSIPQLAALLTDPENSHVARRVLGRMKYPAASAALRAAISRTTGPVRIGIINTVAANRDAQAVPVLARLLGDEDIATACAAAAALGRIGDRDCVAALQGIETAAPRLRAVTQRSLLNCAQRFRENGQTEEAGKLFAEALAPGHPLHIRIGGLRGLALARGARALPDIERALDDPTPQMQASAIECLAMLPGSGATRVLTARFARLSPLIQAVAAGVLGRRGDPKAAPTLVKAIDSDDEGVRIAALGALGKAGGTEHVGLLLQTAAQRKDREQAAARQALRSLSGAGVEAALARSLDQGDPSVRIEAISAVSARKSTGATSALLRIARDPDDNVRQAAITALGGLVSEDQLPELIALALKPAKESNESAIVEAVSRAFLRIPQPQHRAAPVLTAYRGASGKARARLLSLMPATAADECLEVVRQAVRDAGPDVHAAALQALADWPTIAAAEDLLRVVHDADSQDDKVLALRGYVRIAGQCDDPAAMYSRVLDMAQRPQEKWLALSGLSSADTPEALAVAERCLDDETVRAEAGIAVLKIAGHLRGRKSRRGLEAVRHVLAVVDNEVVRGQAEELLGQLSEFEDYILDWVVTGPYTQPGKNGPELHNLALGPEVENANVKWHPLTKGIGDWKIDLEKAVRRGNNCAAYMRTRVWSPKDQDARLEVSSDDHVKVWLNGEQVHAKEVSRAIKPRQDRVDVHLQQGWNDLMMKVTDNGGQWGFACRVRNKRGGPLKDARWEAPEIEGAEE